MSDAQDIARRIEADVVALGGATPKIRKVRQDWSRRLKGKSGPEVLEIAHALALPTRERWVAHELVRFHPAAFAALSEADLQAFASQADSWYAVDTLGTVLAGPAWVRGVLSDAAVAAWAGSPDRWMRRLALVATVGLNARGSGGSGDSERTLAICETLLTDRDDMVVKAMSWALRALSQRHRIEVERFLEAHEAELAARARRELRIKLATGVKTPRRLVG